MTDTNQDIEAILQPVRENPTYLNLWSAFKKIQALDLQISTEKDFLSIAIIGSSTLEPLAACLDVKTRLDGFQTSTYIGGFNTYRQEVLDKNSPLYKGDPDVIVLSVDAASVLDQLFLSKFVRASENQRIAMRGDLVTGVSFVVEALEKNTSAIILVNNFIVPVFSPLGILDNKQKTGLKKFFESANEALAGIFMKSSRVFIVDLDSISSVFGKSRVINWNTWYRGSVPFSEDFTPILADAEGKIPLDDGIADAVFSIAVVPEIPDPVKALREISRLMTRDGIFVDSEVIMDPDYPRRSTVIKWANRAGLVLERQSGNIFHYALVFKKGISQEI